MFREGIAGISWATTGQIRLGKDIAGINANSRMSFWVGTGATNTPNTQVLSMSVLQPLWTRNLPVFNNNAAAASLTNGSYYRTNTGAVMQKF